MPDERGADPWGGATYKGFSGLAEPRPARGPVLNRNWVIGGVAAAVGLGLLFGLAARPDIGQHEMKAAPMQPAAQASNEAIPIEVTKPVVLPAAKPTTPLEVLPPDMARRAAPAATPRFEPAPIAEPYERHLDEEDVDEPEDALPDDAPG